MLISNFERKRDRERDREIETETEKGREWSPDFLWFLILLYVIFPENFIEIAQVVQGI